jgi:hypothetical protein
VPRVAVAVGDGERVVDGVGDRKSAVGAGPGQHPPPLGVAVGGGTDVADGIGVAVGSGVGVTLGGSGTGWWTVWLDCSGIGISVGWTADRFRMSRSAGLVGLSTTTRNVLATVAPAARLGTVQVTIPRP